MKNRDILAQTRHRPYPLPRGPWLMKQTWKDLLFAHWPVNEADLLPYIPAGLELAKWEGRPWISITPFVMDPLRLRGVPRLPFVHRFLEMNIRTYVVHEGTEGIFFLNLDASSRLAVITARRLAHLPYSYAKMTCRTEEAGFYYSSRRRTPGGGNAEFTGKYQAAESLHYHAQPGTLQHWLTEKYCLYSSDSKGRLYRGDIHHLPWPLQDASLHIDINTAIRALGITHEPEPSLLSFTQYLEVLFWPVRRI